MSSKTVKLRIPVNRVEGDLDIEVSIKDNIITDAKSIGTLYRGFENILRGRDPLDALVITPRVCGICSVSHLTASVNAIENAYNITPPKQAVRFRNISLISENLQSDLRQIFLMFMADFANDYYKKYSFYDTAVKLYAPFKGEFTKKVLNITKEIVKIIAYIGGQWPHTSHMVPGGLNVISDDLEVLRIKFLLIKIKKWIEEEILNYDIETFKNEIINFNKLEQFATQNPNSQISIFFNILKEAKLLTLGKTGYGFINYGYMDLENGKKLIPPSIINKNKTEKLDINKITEDVTYSWYEGKNENPFKESTIPNANKKKAYSFTKAPRYDNNVYQTGPLGEELAANNKLISDLYNKFGDSIFVREFARLIRPIRFIEFMLEEIETIILNLNEPLYTKNKKIQNTNGVGLTHAARGALGHWIKITHGKISNYQIISPTTWNGSPKDSNGNLGPWEKALIGTHIKDLDNPVEMGHVIRSFDPCLVCTVHFMGDKNSKLTIKV